MYNMMEVLDDLAERQAQREASESLAYLNDPYSLAERRGYVTGSVVA